MPMYMFKCPSCGDSFEEVMDYPSMKESLDNRHCVLCGSLYRRDYSSECATNNFRPTSDVYGISVKRRAANKKRG